jgi:hypothetical protein
VEFLPPAAPSAPTAITANYSGDATHGSSGGTTHYAAATALKGDITIVRNATVSATGSNVEVPVSCQFPCSIFGELNLGSGFDMTGGEVPILGFQGGVAALAYSATNTSKNNKKPTKPVVLGTGALALSKPGKGILLIKLNQKARRAIERGRGKAFKGVLEVTIRTANGTIVSAEKATITIRPHPKKSTHHKA